MPLESLYDVLQLDSAASAAEIRSAYRRAALLSHPDKGGTSEGFNKVSFAFDVLSNVATRAQYDQQRSKSQAARKSKDKARVSTVTKPRPRHVSAEGKCFTIRVRKAFEQLRSALQSASSDQRRVAIGAMKQSMRVLFLQYMSHFRQQEPCSPCGVPTDSLETAELCRKQQPEAADGDLNGSHAGRKKTTAPRKARESRGIRALHLGKRTKKTWYMAKLTFWHLSIFTKAQVNVDAAIDQHILLVQIRDRAMSSIDSNISDSPAHVDTINAAIQQAIAEVLTERQVKESGLKALASLWVGKHRIESPVLSIQEALTWRARLLRASQSWSQTRSVWLEALQHPTRKQRRSAAEAVDFVDASGADVVMARRLARRSRRQPAKRFAWRLWKAMQHVEQGLAKMRPRKVRKVGHEKRRKELRKWLNRKEARHMTMDDLMEEMPSHLRL